MRFISKVLLPVLLSCFAIHPTIASPIAGSPGIAMPADPKLVVFPYDPNGTNTILARPNAITNLVLAPDEKLVTVVAGDSVQWVFAKAPGHIFIKPIRSDLFTSATIVTSKRTYQITLRSVSERSHWYQRVSWNYPDLMLLQDMSFNSGNVSNVDRPFPPEVSSVQIGDAPAGLLPRVGGSRAQSEFTGTTPDKYNRNYKVRGKAEFAPVEVFDDGKFVWMRLSGNQEQPAVFMLNADGEPELVNWVRKGDFIVVQRLCPAILLKIDGQEVRVTKE